MSEALYIVYWVCLLLLTYTFAGYPFGLWCLSRLLPRRICKLPVTPTVTVVLVVHEEAGLIGAKLLNLLQLDYPSDNLNIVVACDGCRDDTANQCRQVSDLRIRVFEYAERRGKAACLNDVVAAASGELLLLTDVHQQLDPQALRELVANLADPAVGAASSRLCLSPTNIDLTQDAYARYEALIYRAESSSGSMAEAGGAPYAMRRELFRKIAPGTVLDDVFLLINIVAAGARVVFEPLALAWESPCQQASEERGRKVRTLAGCYQLVKIAPWLLHPWSNPVWGRFVSHKLLRLLAPWLLLLLTVCSLVLAARHYVCALTLFALAGYVLLASVDRRIPPSPRWWPLHLAMAIHHRNLLAAQALVTFSRNRRLTLW